MRENIVLVGGGGHCKSCIDVIEAYGLFCIAGIVDRPEKVGQTLLTYPIIGTDDELQALVPRFGNFMVTIGQIQTPTKRIERYDQLKALGASLPAVVSPKAHVSPHVSVGEGTIIMHHVVVNAGAIIGRNCIINTGAIIEHDAVVGDHCHISTGAIVNGGVNVGRGTFVGSNSSTKEYITIPENSFVLAQSLARK